MAEHHDLDIYPVPRDRDVMYINEPWLIDDSVFFETVKKQQEAKLPEKEEDNIRVYIPMDINRKAIIRRLNYVISRYEEANEENEFDFCFEVDRIISQLEIYDQIWYVRHIPKDRSQHHSDEAIELVKEFIAVLESIPDGCAERFPFETIDELKKEYLSKI